MPTIGLNTMSDLDEPELGKRQGLAVPAADTFGDTVYLSPDGNWLIWKDRAPTPADEAHRLLWFAYEETRRRQP